ncbi:Fur family transcriptional regulator [Cellulomonas marina]|uniref:Fur family transcriptional regulator, ferric uptake regulator n=1 Tax=Cellulomonas marina TaxID=988821 RepID=A0A1I0YW94_9CELL|nr:Fur family transcriptional regulator [Cellulomonas marina]GIG27517.1 transcriptional repressor [Cellulomonas marina]SFB16518.1 Fur family transcriptional regulator, ferric uptake regulator [Cellulomonas marina]
MTHGTEDRLRAAGLRVTATRRAVLDTLGAAGRHAADPASPDHPHLTAADVEHEVRARLGTVSTQAVYDCLDALTAAGLLRRVEPAGHPARYETRVGDNHHHLVCRSCGAMVDVACTHGTAPCLRPDDDLGFVLDEAEVTFWGTCPSCHQAATADLPAGAHPTRSTERTS